MIFPVIILAGGLGTRMRPITDKIPKSLIEVAGEPFIVHQLRYLRAQKIRDVFICLGHLGDMVHRLIGDGKEFGLKVTYSYDSADGTLLGTGGAIKKVVADQSRGDHFFILYGDSFLPIDFAEVKSAYVRSFKPVLMTVIKNENRWDSSNVRWKGGQLQYDKLNPTSDMKYIDYGLIVINRSIFEHESRLVFDFSNKLRELSLENKVDGYEAMARFYEIGSEQGMIDADNYLRNGLKC